LKINIVIHSIYGHIYSLAKGIEAGIIDYDPKAEVKIMQVAETLPKSILKNMDGLETKKTMADIPLADLNDLEEADALIFGAPTYFGKMSAQMSAFFDTMGPLWVEGKLLGKIGSAFTSTADQNGGQEETIRGIHTTLLHHGLLIAGVPSALQYIEMHEDKEISGGTCYGASAIAGEGEGKQISENEYRVAKLQGKYVAQMTDYLLRGKLDKENTSDRK
jgi:NAD(P)H dehydrogenase (quinone)